MKKNPLPSIRLSSAEKVADQVKKAILHGTLKPGARLVERDLSQQLGVSRIPIREAFRMLETEGLVRIIPRKGAQVTAFTLEEIDEIYTLRTDLVRLAARLACKNLESGHIESMTEICKQMDAAAQRGELESYFPLLTEFHRLLYQASGNKRLIQILEVLRRQTMRYRFTSLSYPGRLRKSNVRHQELMRALQRGDSKAATRIAKVSIEEARQVLLKNVVRDPDAFGMGKVLKPIEVSIRYGGSGQRFQ